MLYISLFCTRKSTKLRTSAKIHDVFQAAFKNDKRLRDPWKTNCFDKGNWTQHLGVLLPLYIVHSVESNLFLKSFFTACSSVSASAHTVKTSQIGSLRKFPPFVHICLSGFFRFLQHRKIPEMPGCSGSKWILKALKPVMHRSFVLRIFRSWREPKEPWKKWGEPQAPRVPDKIASWIYGLKVLHGK